MHTIFKVKDERPCWFLSKEHLAAYEAWREPEKSA